MGRFLQVLARCLENGASHSHFESHYHLDASGNYFHLRIILIWFAWLVLFLRDMVGGEGCGVVGEIDGASQTLKKQT